MRYFEIFERRRNPSVAQQQKKTIIEQLRQYSDRDDIFISMTEIDKIGALNT